MSEPEYDASDAEQGDAHDVAPESCAQPDLGRPADPQPDVGRPAEAEGSSAEMARRSGGCLCGAVRYSIDGDLRPIWYCHCEHCRRTSGHHVAATATAITSLTVVDDTWLRWYSAQPGVSYGFCNRCGSSLFWRTDDRPATVSIMAGSLDSAAGLVVAGELFRTEAAPYVATHPDAEQVDRDRRLSDEPSTEGCCV